jgi:peptide/nickel transport system ATP-binding protein
MVLYAGEAMELGETRKVIGRPAHPYSWALVNSYPVMTTTKDLRPIRGRPPDPRAVPSGCPFHPRCTQAEEVCWQERPRLLPAQGRLVLCHFGGLKSLLTADRVSKTFRNGGQEIRALQNVSFDLREGEAVGIIGLSGSGKSTLARILTGHLQPDSGQVMLEDEPLPTS